MTAGDKVHCPHCGQRVQVPAPTNHTVLGQPLDLPLVIGQPVPATVEPAVRCHQCGRFFPVDQTVRREAEVSSSSVSLGDYHAGSFGSTSGTFTTTARVDFCFRCAERLDEAEDARTVRTTKILTWLGIGAAIFVASVYALVALFVWGSR